MAYPFLKQVQAGGPEPVIPLQTGIVLKPGKAAQPSWPRRRARFESIEPRVLLSADGIFPGITGALAAGLDDIGEKFEDLIVSDPLMDSHVPGVMKAGEASLELVELGDLLQLDYNELNYLPPVALNPLITALDTLDTDNNDVVSWEEAFSGIFTDQLQAWLTSESFDDAADLGTELVYFLQNELLVPNALTSLFDLSISDVSYSFSDENYFRVEMDLILEFEHQLFADLGAQADQLEIRIDRDLIQSNDAVENRIPVKGGFSVDDFEFGVALDSSNNSDGFFLRTPGEINAYAEATQAWNFDINVGFLGTDATGQFNIDMTVLATMVDPSHPDAVGISQSQLGVNYDGSFMADEALPIDGVLHTEIILDITMANTNPGAYRVTLDAGDYGDADGVVSEINVELTAAGFGDILSARNNGGTLVIEVLDVDPTPLGFNLNQGPTNLLSANALSFLGETSPLEFTFLLSLAGALPKRITFTTTPEDDDFDEDTNDGDLSLAGLVDDLQAALDVEFGAGLITVSDNGTDSLRLSAASNLVITQTFSFGTDNRITQAELDVQPTTELIQTEATDTGLDFDLELNVITASNQLDWDTAPTVHLQADVNGFTETSPVEVEQVQQLDFDLTHDGTNSLVSNPSQDWIDLLDFNVIGAAEVISLVGQLSTWVDRLQDSPVLGAFDLALVDATLGEVLDFADLVRDTLIFDDGDDNPGGNADTNKLLSYANNQFRLQFDTVQTLTSRLATILGVSNGDIGTAYNPGSNELTYNLTLEHAFFGDDGIQTGIDFDEDNFSTGLGSLVDIYADAAVQLEVTGIMQAVFGFTLGDAVEALTADTELATLNGGLGVVINEHLALTSNEPAQPLIGRLSADATFYVTIDNDGDLGNDSAVAVSVLKSSTDANQTLTDLITDINDALVISGIDNLVEAVGVEDRIVIQSKSAAVNAFQVDSSSGNTAFKEMGLQPETAATVSVLGNQVTDVSPASQVRLDITVYKNGVATSETITMPFASISVNNTLSDLVIDFNAALDDAGLLGDLFATGEGDRIRLHAVNQNVESFEVVNNFNGTTIGFTGNSLAALSLRGPEMADFFGQLSADASFTMTLERTGLNPDLSDTIAIAMAETSISNSSNKANAGVDDLVDDLNDKIAASTLNGFVQAINEDNHIVFMVTDASVGSIEISGLNSSEQQDLGLVNVKVEPVLQVVANKAAPETFGIVNEQASFTLNVTNDAVNKDYDLVLTRLDTLTNRSAYDLAGDLNYAINKAFMDAGDINPFVVTVQSGSLVIGLKTENGGTNLFGDLTDASDGVTAFSIIGAPAELALNGAANSDDLTIRKLDGTIETVNLDDLGAGATVGQVLQRINNQTTDVLAEIGDDLASIKLTDSSTPDGSSEFSVRMVNGSPAAIGLGLFASGLNQLEIYDSSNGIVPSSNVIEGGQVATITLDDRFFLKEQLDVDNNPIAMLAADISLSLPEGLEAEATFGFAGIKLTSENYPDPVELFNARLELGLIGQQTIGDLLGSLADLNDMLTRIEAPSLTTNGDNNFSLNVSIEPELDLIGLGANAALDFTINSLGSMELVSEGDKVFYRFTTLPDIAVVGADLGDLANFQGVSFDNILAALDAIASFLQSFAELDFLGEEIPLLGLSFNEILDVADSFSQAVEDIRLNPAGGIQTLEQKVREAFNLPDFADNTQRDAFFDNLGIPDPEDLFSMLLEGGSNEYLRLDLRLPIGFSEGVSIDLDLGEALGTDLGPVDIQGGAGLNVSGYLDARLSFAVNLNTLEVSLYNGISGITGALSAGAENVNFNAAIGPLGAFIKDGVINADINFSFEDGVAADDSRVSLNDLGSILSNFDATLSGSIASTLPVYFPGDSIYLGDIALNLTGLSLVNDQLQIPDFADPGVLTLPDFSNIDLSSLSLFDSIPLMLDGLDFFLMGLQDILDGEVFGFELPFVGDKLAGGADFIEELRSQILDPIRALASQAPELGEDIIQHLLFAILGPGSDALPDLPGIGQTLEEFLGLDLSFEGLGILSNFADGAALQGSITEDVINTFLPFGGGGDFIEWKFRLGDIFSPPVDIAFDLGFPGLALDVDAPLNVEFVWDLAFGIGVSKTDGAYLLIDNPRQVNGETVSDELYLGISATLDESAAIHGELGFLQLDITPASGDFDSVLLLDADNANDFAGDNEGDSTHFSASFSVDLVNKSDAADTRLSFSELGKLDAKIDLTAEAEVNLDFIAKFNEALLPDAVTALLPSVQGNFVFDWAINGGILSGDFDIADSLHIVAFNNVGIDMGSFIGDFLGPVVAQIQDITEPLQPIIDVVTTPIPVISDLFGPTTLLDIAGMTGTVEPAMIYAIADIITFANSIPAEAGTLILPLGSFAIIGPDSGDQGGLADLLSDPNYSLGGETPQGFDFNAALPGGLASGIDDILGLLDGASGDAKTKELANDILNQSKSADSGWAFPIFEDPAQIFGLLLGKDPVLVTYDLAPFGFDFSYTQKFPIWGPIFGRLSLSAGLSIDLAFGYDTFGARSFADGGFENPLDLLAGFYVSDTDLATGTGGTDVPELVLTGELFAGAEVNAGIASVGVEGGIRLTTNFDLYDPDSDGRVRINELLGSFLYEFRTGSPLLAPIAIFDVYGDITAQLQAFIEILFFEKSVAITPALTLFEFSIPFEREPILATERGDGSILLNIGPNSESRLNGDTSDKAESIFVSSIGDNKIKVWSPALGVPDNAAQEYTLGDSKLIEAYGGEGNDIIDLTGVTHSGIDFYIDGGTGDDTILSGAGSSEIYGGEGADLIEGGASDDVIFGDDGPDTIFGNGGADMIFGDGGRITYEGMNRSRVFVLTGDDDGADIIDGGAGDDIIFGGGNSDLVLGGDDDDLVIGDGGRIDFDPATGALIMANGKVDTSSLSSRGEGARDRLFGNAGDDSILGGNGDDLIDGGEHDDQLFGDEGFDVIYGGSGADSMFGGLNDDVMFGFRDPVYTPVLGAPVEDTDPSVDGADYMEGGDGNDYMRGNVGNDDMLGNRGADIIFGDEGEDAIQGNEGGDTIFGGADNDYIEAGDGGDIVFGDDGLLVYYGFYSNPGLRISQGIVVDSGTTGSLVRANIANGDRLVGDGAETLKNGFAADDPDNSGPDSNDRSLDLIITEVNNSTDGDDTIIGGNSLDIVFGGAGNDWVYGDFDPLNAPSGPRPSGNDVLIGDGGRVEYQDRRYSYMATILNGNMDGMDVITGNDGDDIIFGGGNNDMLYGFEVLAAASANNWDALSSAGNDILSSASDNDIILGDNGEIEYDEGIVERIATTDTTNGPGSTGGDDMAFGFKGADVIFGGVNISDATDVLHGNQGQDVLLGDNGELDYDTGDGDLSTLDLIRSYRDGLGGHDEVSGNGDSDVVIGGTGDDMLYGDDDGAFNGAADLGDIILGDNADIVFNGSAGRLVIFGSAVTLITTTDEDESKGGADTVEGNSGADIILGGVNDGGMDRLYGDAEMPKVALDGNDIILGDNGLLDFAFNGDTDLDTLDLIRSFTDNLGGVDIVSGNAGNDVLMGGTAGDFIHGDDDVASAGSQDGDDIALGDNADIFLTATVGAADRVVQGTAVARIITTDIVETTGGADTIEGNTGNDVIVGGVNNGGIDLLHGDARVQGIEDGDDIILGDQALLRWDVTEGENLILLDDGITSAIGDNNSNNGYANLAELETLDLIQTFATQSLGGIDHIFGNDGNDTAMGGTGDDQIQGDFYNNGALAAADDPGDDVLIGDGGEVTYIGGNRTVIRTIETHLGGSDYIRGNDLSDIILGGFNADELYGEAMAVNQGLVQSGAGDDIILGDNGRLDYILPADTIVNRADVASHLGGVTVNLDPSPLTLDRIKTTDPTLGGDDVIYGNGNSGGDASDIIFGGTGSDTVRGDTSDAGPGADGPDGKDLIFGDHGKIFPTLPSADAFFVNNNFFSIDTLQADAGAGDILFGNGNNDVMIGGQADDVMFGGAGDDDMIGGHNVSDGDDDLDAMPLADQQAIAPDKLAQLNPADVNEINDIMDGGSGDDVMAGDNAIIIRQTTQTSPRFRLTGPDGQLYSLVSENLEGLADVDVGFIANVTPVFQQHMDMALVRTVTLLDHSETEENAAVANPAAPRPFGNDIMVGGSDDDEMWGQLGDDVIQGDGRIEVITPLIAEVDFDPYNPSQSADPGFDLRNFTIRYNLMAGDDTQATLSFDVFEAVTDGDDYIEGNGGNDRIYGGLGQDDIIGGSSTLFGLGDSYLDRPDGADLIYGGAGNVNLLARNAYVLDANGDTLIPENERHARDADSILGDNGDIYRIVMDSDPLIAGVQAAYASFAYDYDATTADGFVDDGYGSNALTIRPRAVNFADYGYSYQNLGNDRLTLTFLATARGAGDLIYGESGDDNIHGMTGNDVLYGNSEHDDLHGEIGSDYILGGTGIDGIIGDDGLILSSRNDLTAEPLSGVAARNPQQFNLKNNDAVDVNALNAVISTPGDIQIAIINIAGELNKAVELFAFRTDDIEGDATPVDEFGEQVRWNDIIFGGFQNDFIHGGDGDDAISGAEALPVYYSGAGFSVGADMELLAVNTFLQNQQLAPSNGQPELSDNPFWFAFAPYNPGDILRFEGKPVIDENGQGTRTQDEFAWYDEFNPRRKLLFDFDHDFAMDPNGLTALSSENGVNTVIDFILNFDETEGPDGPLFGSEALKASDGADRLFGDLGNDWMVGGTGRDHMYGGRGDDLLNMDDNHDSGASSKVGPHDPTPDPIDNTLSDEYQAYADIVYSGAGRDVMILNTGADRAIDWVGEYNSYIVPFSPFGAFHISRSLQPQIPEFLYALSGSDGVDNRVSGNPAIINNTVDAQLFVDQKTDDVRVDDPDPLRSYEPYGELGMVRQTDYDWQEQTGAPNDPQAGNFHGKREIMRRELFTEAGSVAFASDVGSFSIANGIMSVTPEIQGEETVTLFHLGDEQPLYMEILVTVNADKATAGWKSNAYIIFDYQGPEDFKFAGLEVGTNKVQIGHRTANGWVVDTQQPMQLKEGRDYDLTLTLFNSVATVYVNEDSNKSLVFNFNEPLNTNSMIGLGTDNGRTAFDDFQVQKLPPVWTSQSSEDFAAGHSFNERAGDWQQTGGELTVSGTPSTPAIMTQYLDVQSFTRLEVGAQVQGDAQAGLIFDYNNDKNFKFAMLDANTDQLIVGHRTSHGWQIDAAADFDVDAASGHNIVLTLLGSTVNVAVDGEDILAHAFNSLLNDGDFGLLVAAGSAAFDDFVVSSDDPELSNALMAASSPDAKGIPVNVVSSEEADSILQSAVTLWNQAHQEKISSADVRVEITDLPGLMLGQFQDNVLYVDETAAGFGWFIDQTPFNDEEFGEDGQAIDVSAQSHIDLLTVISHELGHMAGEQHSDDGLMSVSLESGTRELAESIESEQLASMINLQPLFAPAGLSHQKGNAGVMAEATARVHKENGTDWMIFGMDDDNALLSGWEESENGAWLKVPDNKAGKPSGQVEW